MKKLRIGRLDDNEIVVSDSSVSRNHAELTIENDNVYYITDLNSTNGTFVNGNRIQGTVKLEYNDIVKVGTALVPWRNYLHVRPSAPSANPKREINPSQSVQYSNINNPSVNNEIKIVTAILSGIISILFLLPLFTWSNAFEFKVVSGIDFINELTDKNFEFENEMFNFRYYTLIISTLLMGIFSSALFLINLNIWKNMSPQITKNIITGLFISALCLVFLDIFLVLNRENLNRDIEFVSSIQLGSGAFISLICSFLLFFINHSKATFQAATTKSLFKYITFYMPIVMAICFFSNSIGWFNISNEKFDPSGFQTLYGLLFYQFSEQNPPDDLILGILGLLVYLVSVLILISIYDFKSEAKLIISWITLIIAIVVIVTIKSKPELRNLDQLKIGTGFILSIIANIALLIDLYSIKSNSRANGA